MRFNHALRQRLPIDSKPMIHRRDFNFTTFLIAHRMVGTVMTMVHLYGFSAKRQGQHLVAKTNTKYWQIGAFKDFLYHRHGIAAGRSGIAWAI